jgi:hypothetical protein
LPQQIYLLWEEIPVLHLVVQILHRAQVWLHQLQVVSLGEIIDGSENNHRLTIGKPISYLILAKKPSSMLGHM